MNTNRIEITFGGLSIWSIVKSGQVEREFDRFWPMSWIWSTFIQAEEGSWNVDIIDQSGCSINKQQCGVHTTHVNRGDLVPEEGGGDDDVHAVVGAHHRLVELCQAQEDEEEEQVVVDVG